VLVKKNMYRAAIQPGPRVTKRSAARIRRTFPRLKSLA